MKKTFTKIVALCSFLFSGTLMAQLTPEVLYYNFNGSGTTVPNLASAPPPGTATANIMGGVTQGGSSICNGTLIGTGVTSTTDYLNTGWAPNLGTGAWTISFRSENITPSATLFYIFGDGNTASFRCFTNGVAGANNWILRGGGLTDILITGGATVAPHMNTWVYDPTLNQVRAYRDGVLVNTVAQTAPNLTGAGPFKVMGYNANVGSPLNGHLDEYRVYSRALTPAEITQLYNPFVPSGFLGSDISFCQGDSVALSLAWPSSTVLWSTGSTTSSTWVNSGGPVTVAISGACGSGMDTVIASLLNTSSSTLAASSCSGSYTAPSGAVYSTSGTYMDTIPNMAGCDSIITINAVIGNTTTASFSASACGMYTAPSGAMYMSSGTIMDTIANMSGCDSVMTINVTINSATSSTMSATACDMYTAPSGATYISSGVYMDTIANMMGCDSVITIQLSISNSTSSSMTASACGMYTAPSGAMHSASGTIMDTIPNMAGCDSIITIQLTINSATNSSTGAAACDSYTAPSGAVFTTSGLFNDTITNAAGCDSIIQINLVITYSTTSSMNATACNSYTAPSGAVYTSSGTVTDIIPNAAGCDSTITIALLITPLDTTVVPFGIGGLQAVQTGASYQWIDCGTGLAVAGATSQQFVPSANGYYSLAITNGSCSDTSSCYPAFPIGIEENFGGQVSFYPNPNTGNFVINLGATYDDVIVVITDVAGRVVYSQVNNSASTIAVQLDAAAGVYVVNIVSGANQTTMKLIKE